MDLSSLIHLVKIVFYMLKITSGLKISRNCPQYTYTYNFKDIGNLGKFVGWQSFQ